MITPRLQLVAIFVIALFFVFLFTMLKKNQVALKYALLWMFSGLILLILAVFPGILDSFSRLIGVYSSVNALFAVLVGFIIILMISLTSIVSSEKREIVRLVQELSVLENRVRELEQKPDPAANPKPASTEDQ